MVEYERSIKRLKLNSELSSYSYEDEDDLPWENVEDYTMIKDDLLLWKNVKDYKNVEDDVTKRKKVEFAPFNINITPEDHEDYMTTRDTLGMDLFDKTAKDLRQSDSKKWDRLKILTRIRLIKQMINEHTYYL